MRTVAREEFKQLGDSTSVLRTRPRELLNLQEFSMKAVNNEAELKSPTLFSALKGATLQTTTPHQAPSQEEREAAKGTCGTVLAIMANHHNKMFLTKFQKINSLQLWIAGCK